MLVLMSLSSLESSVLLPVARAPKRKKLRCNDMLAILFSILDKCTPFIQHMQRGNYTNLSIGRSVSFL
jgi:hypothetical protein